MTLAAGVAGSRADTGRQDTDAQVAGWFAAASEYLRRPALACPWHRVPHTGKLARSIVLDLALLDATGDERYWRSAQERTRYVTSRLGQDPQHGAFVFLPGRLDPRNCSNSVIDSGECTDALVQLLRHPRAVDLDPGERTLAVHAVEQNAETYLRQAVAEKGITNQRLWGAMGLASAYRLAPRPSWRVALQDSVRRSLAEQRADGSWGYQPDAARDGVFPGAADLTVYYHSRCLAFLFHILDAVPDLDGAAASATEATKVDGRRRAPDQAPHRNGGTASGTAPAAPVLSGLRRGLDFLAAVITPEGLKPLALEGKRWFWDGAYEAGSNAYDVYALLRGAERFGEPAWADLARRAWAQLWLHQQADGSIRACAEPGALDFVCPDFHTADLAWPAQVMRRLSVPAGPPPAHGSPGFDGAREPAPGLLRRCFPAAGVLRLQSGDTVALVRTAKLPANSQFGGPVGGGGLVYATHDPGGTPRLHVDRELDLVEGSFTLYPARPRRLEALGRYRRTDPPGREGRQWLFVARLLFGGRHPVGAVSRLWRGYVRPLLRTLRDPAATHWATTSDVQQDGDRDVEGTLCFTCRPARPDGSVPTWARDITVAREYALAAGRLRVRERLYAGDDPHRPAFRAVYRLPAQATGVQVRGTLPFTRSEARGTLARILAGSHWQRGFRRPRADDERRTARRGPRLVEAHAGGGECCLDIGYVL